MYVMPPMVEFNSEKENDVVDPAIAIAGRCMAISLAGLDRTYITTGI